MPNDWAFWRVQQHVHFGAVYDDVYVGHGCSLLSVLTREDLDAAQAQWEEWTSGLGFDLTVMIVGEHQDAVMDPDRPVGAIVKAGLSLHITIQTDGTIVFSERCPYDGHALRASVAVLARTIAAQ